MNFNMRYDNTLIDAMRMYERMFMTVGSDYSFYNHKSKTFKKNRRKQLKKNRRK